MRNKLIKFILSFTDYDKIKKENQKLRDDISILIEKPGSLESYAIIECYKMEKQILKMIWMGDFGLKLEGFDGIITHTTI